MTAVDRTAEPADVFAARLAVIEAAPAVDIAADVAEERVARALWEANPGTVPWADLSPRTPTRDDYRRMARAALAAMPPADETLRDEPPCEDGDPDPTPFGDCDEVTAAGRWCGLTADGQFGWVCTREYDHPRDWHIAGDGDEVCAVWPVGGSR